MKIEHLPLYLLAFATILTVIHCYSQPGWLDGKKYRIVSVFQPKFLLSQGNLYDQERKGEIKLTQRVPANSPAFQRQKEVWKFQKIGDAYTIQPSISFNVTLDSQSKEVFLAPSVSWIEMNFERQATYQEKNAADKWKVFSVNGNYGLIAGNPQMRLGVNIGNVLASEYYYASYFPRKSLWRLEAV